MLIVFLEMSELLFFCVVCIFFFKQKTAYEMRISDWSSDVCSSDLVLSNAIVLTRPMVSKALPPLMSSPRRVPTAKPEAIAAGVDSTSAQGQAISNSARQRKGKVYKAAPIASGEKRRTSRE